MTHSVLLQSCTTIFMMSWSQYGRSLVVVVVYSFFSGEVSCRERKRRWTTIDLTTSPIALAQGTSRRQALKLLGGSLAGAVFAAFGGSTVQVAPASIRIFRTFCRDVCKDVERQFRGERMSGCMSCPSARELGSLCIASAPGKFNIACCPDQGCSIVGTDTFCGPPPSQDYHRKAQKLRGVVRWSGQHHLWW